MGEIDWIDLSQYRHRWEAIVNAREFARLAKELLAYQEWLLCTELVSCYAECPV